ncbi:lamin tail domain-containing protein [Candidatus Woesearchaeota archaeon]|nr:lamin tail domain-containing protein [Candidatus Woesearchaeota archaeon]
MTRKFMMAAAAILLLFPVIVAAENAVIISQVIYSPSGTNSGGEAVELYNPLAFSVNISNWVVATETSLTDAMLPQGAMICGGCYYLVADANWSNAKDDAGWPNADYEEAITLANSDAGVALKDSNGTAMDAVGWGNPAGIGSGLFEGSPHSGSSAGNSLMRKTVNGSYADSSNNSGDFIDSAPNFRNSSSVSAAAKGGEIAVMIVVGGSAPVISSLAILVDDDSFITGNQIVPVPGNNRTVSIEATVHDSNGAPDIASVAIAFNGSVFAMSKKAEVNSTAAVYSASLNLSSSFPAGSYAAEPGGTYEISGDDSVSTVSNITLTNEGNVLLDFNIWATNFTSGSSLIEASRLRYAFNGNYNDASSAGVMSNSKVQKDINLKPGARTGLSLMLDVPMAASSGNYSGRISLVAVNG